MKKLLLTALAIASFATASAQDENTAGFSKGDVFISGAAGFNSTKTGDVKGSTFNITPRVGFFASDNIAIGLKAGYTSQSQDNAFFNGVELVDSEINTFEIGAFGRYYATPSSKFSVFGELDAAYTSSKVDTGADVTTNGFAIGVSPGVSYFLSSNFAIEAAWGALQYATSKPDVDGAENTNNFEIGLDLENINLGLVYKF